MDVMKSDARAPMRQPFTGSPFWHFLGRAGLWRLFGNTLPPLLNLRYLRYGNACRAAAGQPVRYDDWPFRRADSFVVRNAMARETALAMVDKVSAEIAAGTFAPMPDLPFGITVPRALDLFGPHILDIFDGPLGLAIQNVMGSRFRIEWLDYYRTIPGEPEKSWLWHIDNDPPFVLKVLLYLTDTTIENGATRILSRKDSKRMFDRGYFGVFHGERQVDFGSEAPPETAVEVSAGDALLFSTNQLHKGGLVHKGFRDALTFLILPSQHGWREDFARRGKDYVHNASGFPTDPAL